MVTMSENKIIDFILNSQQGELIQKPSKPTNTKRREANTKTQNR